MAKQTLPTYAIVELLIRLSQNKHQIGDYKGHTVFDNGAVVRTSKGYITFTSALIKQQFENPEQVTHEDLENTVLSFRASKR